MPTHLVAAIGGGLLSAVLYLAIISGDMGGMLFGYVAAMPLFLAGLALGTASGQVAVATGGLVVIGVTESWLACLTYLLSNGVPVALLLQRALLNRTGADGRVHWYPSERLVLDTTLAAMALIGLAFFGALGVDGGLRGLVEQALSGVFREVLPLFEAGEGDAARSLEAAAAVAIAPVFPGVVMVSWVLMLLVNLILAQAVLQRAGRALRPSLRLFDANLSPMLSWSLLGCAAAGLFLPGQIGYLAINLAIVLALPFFFAGLTIVHLAAAQQAAKLPLLVVFYLLMIVLGWPILVVVGLGAAECWVKLRRRLAAPGADKESR